jgi:hypothetical protein
MDADPYADMRELFARLDCRSRFAGQIRPMPREITAFTLDDYFERFQQQISGYS